MKKGSLIQTFVVLFRRLVRLKIKQVRFFQRVVIHEEGNKVHYSENEI